MTEGEPQPQQPPSSRRRWMLLSGIVALLLVLSLVAYTGGWFSGETTDTQSSPSAETSVEDVEIDFNINAASFYLASDNRPYYLYGDKYPFDLGDREPPTKPVRFTDGAYYPDKDASGDDPHMEQADGTKPIFTDINGDSNQDVVATLEYTGTPGKPYTAWRGVFIWLWQDGQAKPLPQTAAWQWMDCPGESDLEVDKDGLSGLPRITRTGDGNCDGDKNDSQGENPPPQTVFVADGVPVSIGHATGTVERCYFVDMYDKDADYMVTADVEPRLAPDEDAAVIDGTVLKPGEGGEVSKAGKKRTIDQIQLHIGRKPDKKLYDGWIPANIVWTGENEPITCGWVNWADIGNKYKKE